MNVISNSFCVPECVSVSLCVLSCASVRPHRCVYESEAWSSRPMFGGAKHIRTCV